MENITTTDDFGRKPSLTFENTPSEELLVEVLNKGDDQVVEAGDTIRCHHLEQIFNGGVFDNSYDRGQALSFQIGVGMVIRGRDDGLVDQHVSSWVLLSIPPGYGYGAHGVPQAGIDGTDTLMFVTDILDVTWEAQRS